jgi:iron(II)-dependent oxidoreductase
MATAQPTATFGRVQDLRRELAQARDQSDKLFHLITPDALYERPVAERHRLIFYLGHLDAFDWNILARRGMSAPVFHAEFDRLFERGIDPAPGKAPADSAKDWPSKGEVESYRQRTRAWIDAHLEEMDPWILQMAIEHRHMHAETLGYLLHGLPYDRKISGESQTLLRPRSTPANRMVVVEAGAVTLGKTRESFGWDNEHLAHSVPVTAFRMSQFKISNGEYLEFVKEGGLAPHFWRRENDQCDQWFYRGMFAEVPLPLDWPVWVTWHQASAYAAWKGLELPTEAQVMLAAQRTTPDPLRDNFDYNRWDPIAVNAGAQENDQPAQLTGNGWEWTRDLFAPFEGFETHPAYPGYSADFFDGQHYVMKGASPRTARLLTRPSFRNWFRPDYPHMYAGFRLVEN